MIALNAHEVDAIRLALAGFARRLEAEGQDAAAVDVHRLLAKFRDRRRPQTLAIGAPRGDSAFMTRSEAAEALHCSIDTIDRRLADGTLGRATIGRRVLVTRRSVERLERQEARHG